MGTSYLFTRVSRMSMVSAYRPGRGRRLSRVCIFERETKCGSWKGSANRRGGAEGGRMLLLVIVVFVYAPWNQEHTMTGLGSWPGVLGTGRVVAAEGKGNSKHSDIGSGLVGIREESPCRSQLPSLSIFYQSRQPLCYKKAGCSVDWCNTYYDSVRSSCNVFN